MSNNENSDQNFIKTMNKTGYMTTAPDHFSQRFIDFAVASYPELALEIGTAYGVTTHLALAKGANIVANDLDEQHMKILIEKTPPQLRHHLHPVVAKLPQLQFAADTFAAILACRVLHFFTGEQIRICFEEFASWLQPGGKLFLVADSPLVGSFKPFRSTYLKNCIANHPWPGFIENVSQNVSQNARQRATDIPPSFHSLDPTVLCREASRVGLIVEHVELFARTDYPLDLQDDGREGVGFIATKLD